MQLMKRVRSLFSRGSHEERERRRIAKAQRQAAIAAERGRVMGGNPWGFGDGGAGP
jgi:hypothetical protein